MGSRSAAVADPSWAGKEEARVGVRRGRAPSNDGAVFAGEGRARRVHSNGGEGARRDHEREVDSPQSLERASGERLVRSYVEVINNQKRIALRVEIT